MSTPALTAHRLESHLRERGFHIARDSDGDLPGRWDEHPFWFFLMPGSRLQIRGRSSRPIAPDRRAAALLAVNAWNRDRIWPKCYLHEAAGRLHCYTEISVPLAQGLTDAQLTQFVDCGLGTGLRFLTSLREDLLAPAEG